MYTLVIRFYAFVVTCISPFHKKAKKMIEGHKETFDILRKKIDRNGRYIWFHAASLGEFEQGRPMIEKIKREYPQFKILLTFFSPSGYEVRKNYSLADVVCYLPFDTPRNMKRFIDIAKPEMAIFIKYEFWGNCLKELNRRNIPVYIISSIFRPEQLFFQWYGKSYRAMLKYFKHIFVQDEKSGALLGEYGITNVSVCGDTRFDRVIDINKQAKDIAEVDMITAGDSNVIVAGSTWPPDEQIIIPYFNEHPDLKLVIAPHEIHEDHLKSIEALLKRPYVRFSELKTNPEAIKGKDCLIIDNFGMLSSIYRYGDVAYIGGGFGVGIHNTLEAAVYGMPVIFGPNYKRFKEACDLIKNEGAFSISSEKDFVDIIEKLFASEEYLKRVGSNAKDFVYGNAGVTDKIINEIEFKK